jgi:hypothetical protein
MFGPSAYTTGVRSKDGGLTFGQRKAKGDPVVPPRSLQAFGYDPNRMATFRKGGDAAAPHPNLAPDGRHGDGFALVDLDLDPADHKAKNQGANGQPVRLVETRRVYAKPLIRGRRNHDKGPG